MTIKTARAALSHSVFTGISRNHLDRLGALLKSLFDHFLGQGSRKVDLAEKSIRVADAAVSLSEAQLVRTKDAVLALQRELEALKVKVSLISEDSGLELLESLESLARSSADLRAELDVALAPGLPPAERFVVLADLWHRHTGEDW